MKKTKKITSIVKSDLLRKQIAKQKEEEKNFLLQNDFEKNQVEFEKFYASKAQPEILHEDLVSDKPHVYFIVFRKGFYEQLRRMCGIKSKKDKPPIFGHYTNLLIYKRFPTGTLPKLRLKNPKDEATGKRPFYFHQFLSQKGIVDELQFIEDSIERMENYNDGEIQKFLKAYSEEFHIPYQSSLFDN